MHEILKDLLPFIISAITLILSNSNSRRKDDRDGLDDLNERLSKRNEVLTRRVDQLTAENDCLRKELHDNDN